MIDLTTNTQATKIKSSFLITYAVKGIQCHSNRSPQLFELKKEATKSSHVI